MLMKIAKDDGSVIWGDDPAVSGPRNWFRQTLMIREIILRVKKGAYILDVGCGGGELIIRLGKSGYRGIGIDNARGCVTYTQACIQKEGLRSIVGSRRADIIHLPFADGAFDAVTCGEVLEHLDNDARAVHEILRVLKPGGHCVVTVPADPSAWDEMDDISSHVRRYSKEMLISLFVDAGASIVLCKHWGFPFNELWHRYLFLPFMKQKIAGGKNITSSESLGSTLMKSPFVKRCISMIFSFDNLFDTTNKGKALLCVVQKKGRA